MSKYKGLVFEGFSPRTPLGAAAPADSLPDMSRWGNDGVFGAGALEPTWVQLPSGLWVIDYGGDDNVNCGTNNILNFTAEDFSVGAWLYIPTGAGTDRHIISRGRANFDGWYLYWSGTPDIRLFTAQVAAIQGTSSNTWAGNFDSWHLTLTTRVGTTVTIYLDGADDTDTPGVHIDPTTSVRALTLASRTLTGLHMECRMALPRIFNYALNADQIARLFEAERTLFGV